MKQALFHGMTGAALGIVNKEMVTRAMREIANQIGSFDVQAKANEHKAEDLVTSADYAAQQIYVKLIEECTPNAGIVAEEDGLQRDPKHGESIIYTIDPVDGTKALVRKQSDGIGTLFGVVDSLDRKIIASYVGDIMTQEIYYYRPGSDKVHRLNLRFPEKTTTLEYSNRPKKRLLTLDDIRLFPSRAQHITNKWSYFDSMGISNGSIGTNMARLRKWEVDAVLLKAGVASPRDRVPCAGISEKLGYILIQVIDNQIANILDAGNSRSLETIKVPDTLIIHKSHKEEILQTIKNIP